MNKSLIKSQYTVSTDNDSSNDSAEHQTYQRINLESATEHEHSTHQEDEDEILDNNEFERTAIRCFRYFVFFLMVAATVAAGALSWHFLEQEETRNFNNEFDIIVEDIKHASQERASDLMNHFRGLSSTISGLAINSKSTWPFFTDLSFPIITGNFMSAAGVSMVALAPIVKNRQELKEWEDYSQANQGWIPMSLLIEQQRDPFNFTQIFPTVFRNSAGERIPEEGDGPFAPIWQGLQAPRDGKIVNFNLLSDPHFKEIYESLMDEKAGALSDIMGVNNMGLLENFDDQTIWYVQNRPVSMFVAPVFKDPTKQDEIVAALSGGFDWSPLFALPSDEQTPPVDVVLDDGCMNQFTIRVTGPISEPVGFGNLHDVSHEDEERSFPFAPSLPTHHVGGTHCSYQVRIYPTDDFWEIYHTSYPATIAGVITAVFAFVGIMLYLYDWVVHMQERRIQQQASKSAKILSVLYPKNIRDRLFQNKIEEKQPKLSQGTRRINEALVTRANKYQLKRFMKSSPSAHPEETELLASKPIADLFVHATVLFADIAGFTAWSSVREPSQVFTLLETVFQAFDTIAKRRRVFKVETIGDCYVAVTGLPEPTKSHASIMAVFARECVDKFGQLVGKLETTLGPDTGDLGLRVGLHSGSVTAGVLRGDKSRFQLFGGTVDTAQSIEATGQRNRIQVSEETADLLAAAGKSHWLSKRDELVTAKGKGKLQTYWLLTKQEEAGVQISSLSSPTNEANTDASTAFTLTPSGASATSLDLRNQSFEEIENMLTPKTKRLCQWNVEVLARLLKQVVAHRLASDKRSQNWEDKLSKREKEIRSQISVLDEVVEIIPLPGFDQRVYKIQQDPDKIELPEKVIEQIRLYVACIAAMYRDNPFHNFEHASHVMMSVSKLLSRIVAADDILDRSESAQEENLGWSMHDHTYGITSDPMTQFSVILAAMIHDVDHSGVSNDQLIKEEHKLANLFKNKSVAEQNSTVLAWDILMDPRFHDFRRTIYAAPYELDRFRQLMTNTVLATDIMDKELQQLRRNRWEAAFKSIPAVEEGTRDNVNRKATIVIEHLIQASDVAHTMQHWHIYCKWNERLFHEMTVAYRAGRLGFNPAEKWYEGEIGFLDNYVIPLAKKLKNCGVFGVSSDEYLNYAMENRREWEEKGRQFVATLTQRYVDDASVEVMAAANWRSSRRLNIDLDSPNEHVIGQRGNK